MDRQFGDVMRLLASKGVLENAIVVLLSDHGEALGGEDDSMLRQTGSSREIWDSLWGHGTSVMSPHQYQVLLAIRAFGRARLPGPERDYDWPVTLEDLRPTLEELATGGAPAAVDGLSLVPFMAETARASALSSRIRFTETDFNTPRTLAGRYEVSGIVDEAAVFYEIDFDFRLGAVPGRPAARPAGRQATRGNLAGKSAGSHPESVRRGAVSLYEPPGSPPPGPGGSSPELDAIRGEAPVGGPERPVSG